MNGTSEEELYGLVEQALSRLPAVARRTTFGHKGFAFGTSVFAFLDEDRLVVKSEQFKNRELPSGLTFFHPLSGHSWIGIPLTDSLRELHEHWSLIEESYRLAALRQEKKRKRAAK